MSQWIERIKTHSIWEGMHDLGVSIVRAKERKENTGEAIDGLERLYTILELCDNRLAATDPIFIIPDLLDKLESQLSNVKSEIELFINDGNSIHIVAANAGADKAITTLSSIIAPITTEDIKVIIASVSSYRSTLESYFQSAMVVQQELNSASEANRTELAKQAAALTQEQQRLASLILDYQSQFSAAQDRRASEFSAIIAEQNTKYATAAAEQQTAFSSDQDERKSVYTSSQIDRNEIFSALISEYSDKLNVKNKEFEEKLVEAKSIHETNLSQLKVNFGTAAQDVLDKVYQHKQEVEKLVGVIGNLGVTSGYQKVANLARTMLFVWQVVTVIALGGLIYIAYELAFPSPEKAPLIAMMPAHSSSLTSAQSETPVAIPTQKITQKEVLAVPDTLFYQGLAARIFLSLTFGLFAGYAARQASHFLEMERTNRKLALDLEAISSYIAPLNKAQQDEFRLKIGDRSFGMTEDGLKKLKIDDPVTLLDFLNSKKVREFLTKIMKEDS